MKYLGIYAEWIDGKEIAKAKTIEVINCKDCRFWGTEQDGYCAAIDDPYMLETDADDFCSWGERAE